MTEKRQATLFEAFIPLLFLVAALATNVYIFKTEALAGSNQIILILTAAVAAIVSMRLGYTWDELLEGAIESIRSAMGAILILLLIGSLAGTWLLSGIVPAMIYYGLNVLNPTIFLFAACLICALVSLATGSSWSTVATIGIALLGIGKTLGIEEGLVAGAIISGAYFGDKMSPLSDTTNLAPAMAGTDLFTHIRYMTLTTVPSITITLIIFLIWGFMLETPPNQATEIAEVQRIIENHFVITPWVFLVPAMVITLIVRRMPALPALLIGSLLGGVFAVIFQEKAINQVSAVADDFLKSSYMGVMRAMYGTIKINTESAMVTELLTTKGMSGMLNTIWLIVCAMIFGGIMEKAGMLHRITASVIRLANSTGTLIASTIGTCVFFNITASDQYLAIVVPGRMYASTYRERGLAPENLSRSLEDAGTVTSVLIPWNTCGATQAGVLGVGTFIYAPYCFFNIISPFMSVLFGFLQIKIAKLVEDKD